MNNLNLSLIDGRLVRDPELRSTSTGTEICTFALAVNRYYRKNDEWSEEASFFDVETWGSLAKAISENCSKGRRVRVTGRLKQSRWNDDQGKSHSRIYIVAERVEFFPVAKTEDEKELPPAYETDDPQDYDQYNQF